MNYTKEQFEFVKDVLNRAHQNWGDWTDSGASTAILEYLFLETTGKYIPEFKWKVGDFITHQEAQNLPVSSMLVDANQPLYPGHTPTKQTDINESHWVVTANKVSNRCGVIRPVQGLDHWAPMYRIVYIPSSEVR